MKRKPKPLTLPLSVGMTHEDEKTTQIYLDSFGSSVIDEANENLMN
ncbi:MAG TPA: hypothetical protein VF411_07980 [Bacteroidia bacterium]